jgi:hypothetical protein
MILFCTVLNLRKIMFCNACTGTGKKMGNGMIIIDCTLCHGTGDFEDNFSDKNQGQIVSSIDRRSKSYKEAIKEIMNLNPLTTKKEAEKLFLETYDKV